MGYVYLINAWGTDRYKIGITKNDVEKRVKQLQTGCPDELHLQEAVECQNYRKVEGWLHRFYGPKRLEGEWFELNDDEVQAFREDCLKANDTIQFLIESDNPFYN